MYITNKRAGNQRVKQVRNVMSEVGEHIGMETEKFGIVLKKSVNMNVIWNVLEQSGASEKVARDNAAQFWRWKCSMISEMEMQHDFGDGNAA